MFSSGDPTILRELKTFFLSHAVPTFLVGGYIRDSLLGNPTRDIDVAVLGDSLSLAKELAGHVGGAYFTVGQSHQIARVIVPSQYDGSLTIDVSSIDGSIHNDLARRDFTVDALALSVDDWDCPSWEERVVDLCDGKKDLSRRLIRAVRPSVFREDPARLLRAVRLAASLGFQIEAHTSHLIAQESPLISTIAGERVRDEFLAILTPDGCKCHLEMLDELGLLSCIIPELEITKGVEQPKEHHWDVFGHSLQTVEGVDRVTAGSARDSVAGLAPWDQDQEDRFAQEVSDGHSRRTMLKLAALLHDIAKPQTKMVDAKGRTRFLGHHTMGASMAKETLKRLRVSHCGIEMVRGLVEHHLRPTQMSHGAELPTSRAVYRYFRDVGDVAVDTLYLSLADHLAARGPELDLDAWSQHAAMITHVLEVGTREQAPERMARLTDGHDLMNEFGLSPGPLIGTLLEDVRDAQAAGEVGTRQEALDRVRTRLYDVTLQDSGPKGPAG